MLKSAREAISSQARPQPFTQDMAGLNLANPQGPDALAKTPLRTSVICKLIMHEDTLDETASAAH